MKKRILLAALIAMAAEGTPVGISDAEVSRTLIGRVITTQQLPVSGARLTLKHPSGKILAQASSNMDGRYSMRNLPAGRYELTLDALQQPYRGESVVASLAQDLTVNWVVLQYAAAVATASPGVGPASTAPGWGDVGTVVLINAVGGGLGTGIAAAAGGFDKKTGRRIMQITSGSQ